MTTTRIERKKKEGYVERRNDPSRTLVQETVYNVRQDFMGLRIETDTDNLYITIIDHQSTIDETQLEKLTPLATIKKTSLLA